MSVFTIGDRVRIIDPYDAFFNDAPDEDELPRDSVFTIVEDCGFENSYFDWDQLTVDFKAVDSHPDDFDLVEDVISVKNQTTTAKIITEETVRSDAVATANIPSSTWSGVLLGHNDVLEPLPAELVESLGMYRPNIETRKVGKVQQHMVDDGFPNALKAVAEVMTWAANNKGYKLHDWKNLPDADIEFPSAEGRHRTENSIQKASGLKALERTDHESNLLHVAHKVFNGLAELELILTGVIK